MSSQHNNNHKSPTEAALLPLPQPEEFDLDFGLTSMEVDDLLLSLTQQAETPNPNPNPNPNPHPNSVPVNTVPVAYTRTTAELTWAPPRPVDDLRKPRPSFVRYDEKEKFLGREVIIIDSSESESEGEKEDNDQDGAIFAGTCVDDPVIVDDD